MKTLLSDFRIFGLILQLQKNVYTKFEENWTKNQIECKYHMWCTLSQMSTVFIYIVLIIFLSYQAMVICEKISLRHFGHNCANLYTGKYRSKETCWNIYKITTKINSYKQVNNLNLDGLHNMSWAIQYVFFLHPGNSFFISNSTPPNKSNLINLNGVLFLTWWDLVRNKFRFSWRVLERAVLH